MFRFPRSFSAADVGSLLSRWTPDPEVERAAKEDSLDRSAGARVAGSREVIAQFLEDVRWADRSSRAASGLARALAIGLGVTAAALALDLLIGPPAIVRALVLSATVGLTAGAAVIALLAPIVRRTSDRWLAYRTETKHPELEGMLSVVASDQARVTAQTPRSQAAADALAPVVERALAKISAWEIAERREVRGGLALALAAAVIVAATLAGYAAVAPARLGRAVALESEPGVACAPRILTVRPGAVSVHEEQTLPIEVGVEGEPESVSVVVRSRSWASPPLPFEEQRLPLVRRASGRFGATLPAFSGDATYKIVVGDAGVASADFAVQLIRAPSVVSVSHREEPPAYLDEPARDVAGGDVTAVEGTRIVVRATTSSEATKARLRATWVEDGIVESLPLVPTGPCVLEGAFTVKSSGTYRVEYEDATGLALHATPEHRVTAERDLPPRVAVLAPSADREIAVSGSLAVEYEARDDHGIGELALHLVVHGGKPKKLLLPLGPDSRRVRGTVTLSPHDLGLLPGDSAVYYLVALDRKAPLPNRAATAPFVLAIEDDAKLREELTGIDAAEEDVFRSVEASGDSPETASEIARNQEAIRRLERMLARESVTPESARDVLQELTPDDLKNTARALEDLEQDPDSVLSPEESDSKNADGRDAKGEGDPTEKGDGRGHERGSARGQGRGAAHSGGREAQGGGRPTIVTRAGSGRQVTRLYRELLEKRRELLRRLARDVDSGRVPAETMARLGPGADRLLEALRRAGDDTGGMGAAPPSSSGRGAGRRGLPPRALRVRPEIPQDTVALGPRRETSPPSPSAAPSHAAAWDESLPEELREVVKGYFRPAK